MRDTDLTLIDGLTLYQTVRDLATGFYWTGAAFEAFNAAHWTSYALPLTKAVLSAGVLAEYYATFPSGVVSGAYHVELYVQVGGSPAITDGPPFADYTGSWSGTVLVGTLPDPQDAGSTVGYLYTRNNAYALTSGIRVQVGRRVGAGVAGLGILREPQTATSSVSPLGLVTFQLAKGGAYSVRIQDTTGAWGDWVEFVAPNTDNFAINEALGPGYAL